MGIPLAKKEELAARQAISEKGQANGYAPLDSAGKLPTSTLPSLSLTDVYEVVSQAAQLALTAQEGDVAVRSDQNKAYIHNGGVAGTMADWTLLSTPTDLVLSVNGQTGVVSLAKGDVGLGSVDNTADSAKPVSGPQQTALAAKQDAATAATDAELAAVNTALDARLDSVESGGVFVAAPTGVAATDQAAIDSAVAVGGLVQLGKGQYLVNGIVGANDVTLRGCGEETIVKLANGANADVIKGSGLTGFVVEDLVIDGNKANQTITALYDSNDADEAKATKGIAFYNCTRSGARCIYVHDTRFHGFFVSGGDHNFGEDIYAADPGLITGGADSYGTGIKIISPRFKGRRLIGIGGPNSGVVTSGGATNPGIELEQVYASGTAASPISINSIDAKLEHFYASGAVGMVGSGLTLGHAGGTNIADGVKASHGMLTGNLSGSSIAACFDGTLTDVTFVDNHDYNLNVFGALVGRMKYVGCDFDGTDTTGAGAEGTSVLLTSVGAAGVLGGHDFHGCSIRNAVHYGLLNAGVPEVRVHGGNIEDNTGAGARSVDNTTAPGTTFHGTAFRDTRSGASRTQTMPIQNLSLVGYCHAYNIRSSNHLTQDAPSLLGPADHAIFTDGTGDRLRTAGLAAAWQTIRVLARFEGGLGGAAVPPYAFNGRADQGMYSRSSASLGWAIDGLYALGLTANGLELPDAVSVPDAPSVGATIYPQNGMLRYKGTDGVARPLTPRAHVLAADQGVLSETYPRALAASATTMIGGTIYLVAIGVLAGDVITNVHVTLATGGTTMSLSKVGLYSAAGDRLAVSADLGTSWEAGTLTKTNALTGPYTVLTTGAVYVGFVAAAVVLPQLYRASLAAPGATAIGANIRSFATGGTGQTDLPANVTVATGAPISYWAGVS